MPSRPCHLAVLSVAALAAGLATALTLARPASLAASQGPAAQERPAEDSLLLTMRRLEAALLGGSRAQLDAALAPGMPTQRGDELAADLLIPGTTRAVVKERDRIVLPDAPTGTGFRVIVEFFLEAGDVGRIITYRLDLLKGAAPEAGWQIADFERLTGVDGLYRLSLDSSHSFAVKGLQVRAEDFELTLPRGTAFVARAAGDVTALVLIGDGTMNFSPRPASERVQVRLFSGSEALVTPFTAVYLRFGPADYKAFVSSQGNTEQRDVDPRLYQRASEMFTALVGKSFSLDLSDLSRDTWSLLPGAGDIVAEVRTRKYDVLTYARANGEAEDITLFDRVNHRNIAVYPSEARRQARGGRGYNEDNLIDYDILDYVVESSYVPERSWLDGRTTLRLQIRAFALATLTVRLEEPLVVSSVRSDRHGRLLALRVRNQNSVIVSLPKAMSRDDILTLTVTYAGRLEAQPPDREVAAVDADQAAQITDLPQITAEPRWVLSNRTHWYPQNTVSDYATGVLRLTVPSNYDVAASGDPAPDNPSYAPGPRPPGGRTYLFTVNQPARYFSWLITRLLLVGRTQVALADAFGQTSGAAGTGDQDGQRESLVRSMIPDRAGVYYQGVEIIGLGNPRQNSRCRTLMAQAAEILAFYGSVLDDFPYPSLTIAAVDDEVPGGHSPAYLAIVSQQLPTSPFTWRNDPVHFDDFPRFFLAHEIAHQYWGQAIGWKSYHEQWISEGFAQYFALMYAERYGGRDVARGVVSRLRATALAQSYQGPINLGYRLGHVRGESRVFRSLVYNKAALVLHMLRRLLGDEAFFRGLRRFYRESRFMKVGTDEAREAFEEASGRSLTRFFQRWISEFAVPTIRYATRVDGDVLEVVFEQPADAIHDLPVTVSVEYTSGTREDVIVPVTEARTSVRLPLKGAVRRVEVNDDNAALARFEKM